LRERDRQIQIDEEILEDLEVPVPLPSCRRAASRPSFSHAPGRDGVPPSGTVMVAEPFWSVMISGLM